MAYSVYLLHGIALFVLFTWILGRERAAQLSALSHWTIVAFATPVLVLICHITFRTIELPGMRSAPGILSRISHARQRSHLGAGSTRPVQSTEEPTQRG